MADEVEPAVVKTERTEQDPRGIGDVAPRNRASALLGLVLLAGAVANLAIPQVGSATGPLLPNLFACVGLGLILFAVGNEAKITGTGFTASGASAIAVLLFGTLQFYSGKLEEQRATLDERRAAQEQRHLAYLTVARASSTDAAAAKVQADLKPEMVTIHHRTGSWSGKAQPLGDTGFPFLFELKAAEVLQLGQSDCPMISVRFGNGAESTKAFRKDRSVQLSSYGKLFDLVYQVDKGRVYSISSDSDSRPLSDCDDQFTQTAAVTRAQNAVETGEARPPAVPALENKPLPRPTAPSSAAPPAAAAGARQIIGYVLFNQYSNKSKAVTKRFFDIEGKPDARVPVPNDVLVVVRKSEMLSVPYHWDSNQRRHMQGRSRVDTLQVEQRVTVAADCIVAHDENIDAYYLIVPIASVQGRTYPAIEEFRAESKSSGVLGYSYAGSIDQESGELSGNKIFENLTRPDAIYPAPNDVLVARSNVWLRAGPNSWDLSKQEYVSAEPRRLIAKGLHVRVGGDTRLARGGLSIWAPIDRIGKGIEEIAQAD